MFRPFGTPAAGTPTTNPFGSTSSVSGFGSTTGSAFGAQAVQPAATNPFGQAPTMGGFGQQPASNPFGAAAAPSGFGMSAAPPAQTGFVGAVGMSVGTGNPPYSSTADQEANMTIHHYCISAMPAYRNKSLEELRLEDYQSGKKGATGFAGSTAGANPFGFGGGAAQPAASTGSMFGIGATPAATSSFGFGKPAAPATTSGFGGFGQPAAPAATSSPFGFGTATAGAFGQPAAQTNNIFGQPAAATQPFGTQPQQPAAGMFGGQQPTTAAPGPFGGFGAQPAPSATGLTGFGQPAAATASPFGTAAATNNLFGQKPATPGAAPGTTFGFGQPAAPTAPSSTGFSFGNTPAAQPAASTATSFGFGQPAVPAAPSSTGFSFGGAAPAASAATTTPSTGFSFGNAAATTGATGTAGFGLPSAASKPTFGFGTAGTTSTSTLGTTGTAAPFSFTGLGATSTTTATTAPSAFSTLPLITPPDAQLLSLKPPMPAGLATSKENAPPAATPSTSTTASTTPKPARLAADFIPRAGFTLKSSSIPVTPAFSSGSTSGAALVPRTSSVKKLSLARTPSSNVEESGDASAATEETSSEAEHYGDYYMIPALTTLKRMSYSQLAAVTNLTIGQRGVGQIRFLRSVDLTGLDLDAILDHLVVFGPSQVVVYPEDDFPERPPTGTGLNQPAEVRLERCWPTSRSSRDPITEMGGERMRRHIERLKAVQGTHFVDFVPESGTWVFTVDHF